jgi:hypothetical protein
MMGAMKDCCLNHTLYDLSCVRENAALARAVSLLACDSDAFERSGRQDLRIVSIQLPTRAHPHAQLVDCPSMRLSRNEPHSTEAQQKVIQK